MSPAPDRSSPPPDRRRLRGRLAEHLAAWWLRLRGWSILSRGGRLAGVEVDLLALRGEQECLVEVKSRRLRPGEPLPGPEELLGREQLRRLARAAALRRRDGRKVRIDLVAVLSSRGRLPRVIRYEGLEARSEVER